jgi:pyruvate-formate lyase-activating enzyme
MGTTSIVRGIVELTAEITAAGPDALAWDGLRVLQHPERFRQVLLGDGANVVPVTVDLWPSLSCNARCPSCPYRRSGARNTVDRSSELALLDEPRGRAILDGMVASGVRSVVFTGGGDPLLHPRIVAMAHHARHQGLKWALFTNGIALKPALAESLLREEPAFLRVSLDAGTPALHAHTYCVNEAVFSEVVRNIVGAARIASERGLRSVGLSFTLEPRVEEKELCAIRRVIEHVRSEAGTGLGLVAFRPRLVHYLRGVPCVPQPDAELFVDLADRIAETVIAPLVRQDASIRLDIKRGLFRRAAVQQCDPGCLSAAWMTTLDQEGVGYITAELAGLANSGQAWGRIVEREDFARHWFGSARRTLHAAMETGRIGVPLVHRTSPVDSFLRALGQVIGGALEAGEVDAVVASVATSAWYRSPNPDFV